MPRPRTGIAELGRVLNAVPQPIYLLDDEQRIVFCNQACLDWVGCTAEELHDAQCRYHSNPEVEKRDAVAAGLCPPPAAMNGNQAEGVIGCARPDGRVSRRRARFLPLGEPGAPAALLVLVDPEELPETEEKPPAAPDEAARLHDRVRAYRCQAAERCRLDRLVGDSPATRQVRAQIEVAAASRASVLLVGPPGSGRQHAAAAIHYGHPSAGPLIPLACAVLEADLVRSTLAALGSRRLPPEAAQGTLLLNDADQLPPDVQADVARVLSRSFPMRVISTARRRLFDLVRDGPYRDELACALSTLVIELPPLRQRRADLPALLQLFLEDLNARKAKQVGGFSPEALDLLDGYPWPGNMDELIEVVSQAHEHCEGIEIGLRDLPAKIHMAASAAAHPRRPEETIVLDEFLARIERELLCRAMARAKGNKAKAAKLLGMTRPRLYRRLVQLGLEAATEGPGAKDG